MFDFLTNRISISMKIQKLIIPNGQSILAELVLYQPSTVTIQKKFGLSSVGFFIKKFDPFILFK